MTKVGKQAGRDRNRVRTGWAGRQVGKRAGGWGGLTVHMWAVGARLEVAPKPGRSQVGSASWVRAACLVDGAQQKT